MEIYMEISNYRIVMPKAPGHTERRAATFLQTQIRMVRGVKLPIVTDETTPCDYEFVIGRTTREAYDGVVFNRQIDTPWEFVIKTVGTRVYLTGMGALDTEPKPYTSGYTLMYDNANGTAHAVYRYVEDVLGYNFSYLDWDGAPEYDELDVPEYNFSFTRELLRKQEVELFDGTAMYSMLSPETINWNNLCIIFKTKAGKLVVIDGGRPDNTERLLSTLERLSGGKKPVVEAWFLSHLHSDHYGPLLNITRDESLRERVTIKNFYHKILPAKYYNLFPAPKNETWEKICGDLLSTEKLPETNHVLVNTGDRVVVDELTFDVIHAPYYKDMFEMNINDSSVVIRVDYNNGEQGIMLLGDAEHVCSNDMTENFSDKLKSEVVFVGHHGCGNVSRECYEMIGADVYIWPTCARNWYGDNSEGPHTHNIGILRTRTYMKDRGIKNENIYRDSFEIQSFKLPIEIK